MELNLTESFKTVLLMRGMAYYTSEGVFTLNRKGRRYCESQAGKKATTTLRKQAHVMNQGRRKVAEVKEAWADKRKLDSAEK